MFSSFKTLTCKTRKNICRYSFCCFATDSLWCVFCATQFSIIGPAWFRSGFTSVNFLSISKIIVLLSMKRSLV